MTASEEARRLQARDLEHQARRVAGVPAAAAAIIYVAPDGTLNVACSCGDADLAHPSGREKYTLDRLSSHMQLHATAALTDTPWEQVLAHRDRLRARRPGT